MEFVGGMCCTGKVKLQKPKPNTKPSLGCSYGTWTTNLNAAL